MYSVFDNMFFAGLAGVLSAILVLSCAYGNHFNRFRPLSNFRILDGKIGDLDTISINNTRTGQQLIWFVHY